eukprot:Em0575g5a
MLPSVEYLGYHISGDGVRPTQEKLQAIVDAPAPKDISQLKSFLGLVNYYSKFLPHLANTLAPLYALLKKHQQWCWGAEQEEAFKRAKSQLASDVVLAHFDPQQRLAVACDASPYGVGAVLSHLYNDGSERPIAYASRSLAPAERKYSHIEKEGLAVVFGVKKFHQYLLGRKFVVFSDHKPLQFLFCETRPVPPMASARIQRWALTLSAYNYQIVYRPSQLQANADGLSRLPLKGEEPGDVPLPGDTILMMESLSNADSVVTATTIRSWTDKDPVLSLVRRMVLHGWQPQASDEFRPYEQRKLELSVQNGCVLWGSRVVVPPQGRQHVLEMLHEGHPGISRMKSLARGIVWWPKLDADQETLAIQALRRVFSTHGLPQILVSDNGAAFSSSEFQTFVARNGFKHVRSAPYHPATNGLAERAVQTVKDALKKTSGDIDTRLSRFLFQYRLTPHSSTGQSPAKLLLGRVPRSHLDFLFPDVADNVKQNQQRQKQNHDQRATERFFVVGDKVYALNHRGTPTWLPGTVSAVSGSRSLTIKFSDGRESRYHADHVRAREQDGRGGKEDEDEDDYSPTECIQDQEEETLLATDQNQAPPANTHREDTPPAPTPPPEEVHVHPQPASVERYALCVTGEDEPSAALFDQELAISSDAELIQDSTASTTLQLSSDASGSEQPDIDRSNDAANVPVTNPDRSEEELEADTSIGNPEISHNLVRYPVIPKGEFNGSNIKYLCDNLVEQRCAVILEQQQASIVGFACIGCLRNKPDMLCQIARIQSARTQKEMKQLQKEFGCNERKFSSNSSFSFSGFDMKLSRNVAKYFKSFVGRDFKILAQLALFVLPPYLTPGETEVWFALSKVFKFVYCDTFLPEMVDVYKSQCLAFTHAVERNCPELRRKLKIHILLHLPDDMLQFGPASTFNTERCESYNAAIRGRNIYANRHAPRGHYDALEKCGDELVKLYKSSEVDDFLRGGASAYVRNPRISVVLSVGKTKVALGSVLVRVQEIEGNISISSLMENHPQFTLLLPPMLSSFNTLVSWGKATVGTDRNIVNVGDFAQYNDGTGSTAVGVILCCIERNSRCYVIVRQLEPLMAGTEPICNDFDCPLYSLTSILRSIPSAAIIRPVSVVHQCTSTCSLQNKDDTGAASSVTKDIMLLA